MTSISDVRDVLRGAAATLGGFGGRVAARLILMIAAGHYFGAAEIGYLGQVAAIVEICAAIGVMGLKRTLIGMMSEKEAKGEAVEGLLLAAIFSALILSLGLSIVLGLIWPYVLMSVGEMPPIIYAAIPAIVMADVLGAATRFKRIIRWDVLARSVIEPWSFLLAAMVLYALGLTEKGLLVAYTLSVISAALFCAVGAFKEYWGVSLRPGVFQFRDLYRVPKASLPAGVIDLGVMAFRRIDILILGVFAGAEVTGIYYMVQQLATVPHKVYQLFEPMMAPVIARLHHNFKPRKIEQKLRSTCRWVFTLQVGLTVPFIVFSTDALGMFGGEFQAGASILFIIMLAELSDGSFALLETFLVYTSPHAAMVLILGALAVEIIAVGVGSFLWGGEGAALGFLLAMASLVVGRIIVARKRMGISVVDGRFLRPLPIAAIVALGLATFKMFSPVQSGALVAIMFALGLAIFLFGVRQYALSPEDEVMYRRIRGSN